MTSLHQVKTVDYLKQNCKIHNDGESEEIFQEVISSISEKEQEYSLYESIEIQSQKNDTNMESDRKSQENIAGVPCKNDFKENQNRACKRNSTYSSSKNFPIMLHTITEVESQFFGSCIAMSREELNNHTGGKVDSLPDFIGVTSQANVRLAVAPHRSAPHRSQTYINQS